MVRHVGRVDRVAVTTGASVKPNVCPLFGSEFADDLIDKVHERLKQILICPGVSRVLLRRQS